MSRISTSLLRRSGPILVTGHTGFKGAWLLHLLRHLGIAAIGYSLPPEPDCLYLRSNLANQVPEHFGDIRNYLALEKFINNHQPAGVIHLAAQALVLDSYTNPRETFEVNVIGTTNVLNAAFACESVKGIVVATTDKVYRNTENGKSFIETDPLEGKDPYSASKVGTEAAVSAWQQSRKISGGPGLISARAGNVIGGGDWGVNRLLPDLIRGFMRGGKILVRNPESTRPWQHVLDPISGYLMALDKLLQGGELSSINFGPDSQNLSVAQVAELASREWSSSSAQIVFGGGGISDKKEAVRLNLNAQLAKELLGWNPVWDQESSVIDTVRWWKSIAENRNDSLKAIKTDLEKLDIFQG